jgi:hypothetical protein
VRNGRGARAGPSYPPTGLRQHDDDDGDLGSIQPSPQLRFSALA